VIFILSGTDPEDKEQLKICNKGTLTQLITFLSKCMDTLLRSGVFLSCKLFSARSSSSDVTGTDDISNLAFIIEFIIIIYVSAGVAIYVEILIRPSVVEE
jgi:hypothetical protein